MLKPTTAIFLGNSCRKMSTKISASHYHSEVNERRGDVDTAKNAPSKIWSCYLLSTADPLRCWRKMQLNLEMDGRRSLDRATGEWPGWGGGGQLSAWRTHASASNS